MSRFIRDDHRDEIIREIRGFLSKAAHAGGVFVLCGSRGAGKTRVVDEAIVDNKETFAVNSPNRVSYVFSKLLAIISIIGGRNPHRKKRTIFRHPRALNRHIIKVDIRFPLNLTIDFHDVYTKGSLLDTIIFELTSQVDPRASRRLYGKTLRQQLGFWRYWFSWNGLILPGAKDSSTLLRLLIVLGLVLTITGFSGFLLWIIPQNVPPLLSEVTVESATTVLMISTFSLIGGWAFLRFLDRLGFKRFSDRLYAITHAEKMQQSANSSNFNAYIHSVIKTDLFKKQVAKIVAPASALFGSFVFSCSKLGGCSFFFIPDSLIPIILITTLLLFIISASYLQSFSLKGIDAVYDGNNNEWKITLLRRYLFLLHQLGIEPVLVLDELDKLEGTFKLLTKPLKNISTIGSKGKKKERDEKNIGNQCYKEVNGLTLLFSELIPLKQNLGAHFLWILIGDSELMTRLLKADERYPPGKEATIIHKYMSLNIVDRGQVHEYMDENYDDPFCRNRGDFFWIMSRGLYADLYSQDKSKSLDKNILDKATQLAVVCETCIDDVVISTIFPRLAKMSVIYEVRRRLYTGLLMGALDGARSELMGVNNDLVADPILREVDSDMPALRYDTNTLIAIGRNLFFVMLGHNK